MMKVTLILILLSCTQIVGLAQQDSQWLLDFERAKEVALKENKTILISFAGSDWCKPCIKLTREVFEAEEFSIYASDNLVLLLLDFPRLKKNAISKDQLKHNEMLAERYNQDGVFPLVVLTDHEGNVISQTGYRPGGAESFIHYLNTSLEK